MPPTIIVWESISFEHVPMDALLKQHAQAIRRIAARHGVTRLRIVGSRAREEAGPDSDLDILVNLKAGCSALDLAGLKVDLEDLLGCRVDVGEEEALRPPVRDRVLKDAVEL